MKKTMILACAASLLGMASLPAISGDVSALLQKGGCTACHAVDKKVLGPAFKDVATKYKGQKEAHDKLVSKVKAGGSGVWGPMPMPPNAGKLSDDEFNAVVDWVLAQ